MYTSTVCIWLWCGWENELGFFPFFLSSSWSADEMEGEKDGELGVSCALFFLGILLTYRSIFTRERGRPSFLILLFHFLQFFSVLTPFLPFRFTLSLLSFIFPTRFLCSREPNACFTPVNHHLQLHLFIFSHTLFTVYSSSIHDPLSHFLLSSSHLPLSSSHRPFSSSSLSSHLHTLHSHISSISTLIFSPFLSPSLLSPLSLSSSQLPSHLLPFRIIFPHSILILTLASLPLSSYRLFTHICTPVLGLILERHILDGTNPSPF
jgi:hypothetical protein